MNALLHRIRAIVRAYELEFDQSAWVEAYVWLLAGVSFLLLVHLLELLAVLFGGDHYG